MYDFYTAGGIQLSCFLLLPVILFGFYCVIIIVLLLFNESRCKDITIIALQDMLTFGCVILVSCRWWLWRWWYYRLAFPNIIMCVASIESHVVGGRHSHLCWEPEDVGRWMSSETEPVIEAILLNRLDWCTCPVDALTMPHVLMHCYNSKLFVHCRNLYHILKFVEWKCVRIVEW